MADTETEAQFAARHGYTVRPRRAGWFLRGPRQKARAETGVRYLTEAEAWLAGALRIRRAKLSAEASNLRQKAVRRALSAAPATSSK